MAIHKNTHAHHVVNHLSRNERNALRILLLTKTGLADLREALGTEKMRVLTHAEVCYVLARAGRTVELFRDHMRHVATDLKPEGFSVEVGQ